MSALVRKTICQIPPLAYLSTMINLQKSYNDDDPNSEPTSSAEEVPAIRTELGSKEGATAAYKQALSTFTRSVCERNSICMYVCYVHICGYTHMC